MQRKLEISEGTDRRGEAAAGELGISLGEEGGRERGEGDRPWLVCAGALAHLHEETVRIQRLVDEEFGGIEAEDWA